MITEPKFEIVKKKLNLVSVEPGRKALEIAASKVTVTVNSKTGLMSVGKASVEAMAMNKCWIKWSFDVENKVLAWQVRHELDNDSLKEQGWKFYESKDGGMILSVGRIVRLFEMKQETYQGVEVKKYQAKSVTENGSTYYFVDMIDAELNWKAPTKGRRKI